MPADLDFEFKLNAAPEKVFNLLCEEEYLSDKVALASAGDFQITGDPPNLKVKVTRVLDTELPEMVKRVVGDNLTATETYRWSKKSKNEFFANFDLEILHAPVEIKGLVLLTGDRDTSVKVAAKVKVHIPIFGAVAEPEVVKQIIKVLQDEELLCNKAIEKTT